jgi:hypothetical protein
VKALAFFLAAAVLSGCATVGRVDGSRCTNGLAEGRAALESVQVMNSVWKLFSFIPLASGDPLMPNGATCRFFEDTATLQNQLDMLQAEVRRVGATKVEDVVTMYSEERVFFFLLLREKIRTSATLVR